MLSCCTLKEVTHEVQAAVPLAHSVQFAGQLTHVPVVKLRYLPDPQEHTPEDRVKVLAQAVQPVKLVQAVQLSAQF